MFSGGYLIISIVLAAIGFIVQRVLISKMKKYGSMMISRGMSGKQIAESMLRYYNISGVQVISGEGMLTDYYNPANKTVTLSPDVYNGQSIMSAAVAAHECGHAVQHATAYSMLQLRSKLVPAVQVASFGLQWMMLISFMLANRFPQLLLLTIGLFALTTIFSIITLPVEFDASRRALVWLNNQSVLQNGPEMDGGRDALKWAAMTYLVAALSSIVMLVYLVLQYMGLRRND
ncbi:MAG: zinc metallopeptidase [Saprospiraceae bacterium]